MKRAMLVLLVPLLLGACGSTGPDDSHSLTGEWVDSDLDSDEIRMTVSVTNREVSGYGSIASSFSTFALTIDGAYVPPSVSLNLGMERFDDINFEGSFEDDNTIVGTLRGSGFDAQAVTFERVEEGEN